MIISAVCLGCVYIPLLPGPFQHAGEVVDLSRGSETINRRSSSCSQYDTITVLYLYRALGSALPSLAAFHHFFLSRAMCFPRWRLEVRKYLTRRDLRAIYSTVFCIATTALVRFCATASILVGCKLLPGITLCTVVLHMKPYSTVVPLKSPSRPFDGRLHNIHYDSIVDLYQWRIPVLSVDKMYVLIEGYVHVAFVRLLSWLLILS